MKLTEAPISPSTTLGEASEFRRDRATLLPAARGTRDGGRTLGKAEVSEGGNMRQEDVGNEATDPLQTKKPRVTGPLDQEEDKRAPTSRPRDDQRTPTINQLSQDVRHCNAQEAEYDSLRFCTGIPCTPGPLLLCHSSIVSRVSQTRCPD